MHLGVRVGEGCERLHDALFRKLNVAAIELDEQWAFINKKQKRVRADDPREFGDAYLFIAGPPVKPEPTPIEPKGMSAARAKGEMRGHDSKRWLTLIPGGKR